MAVLATNDVEAQPQLNRLPSQDKGARRVAFTGIPPKNRSPPSNNNSDGLADGADYGNQKKCRPRLFACCAWTCLGVFGIILFVLTVGVIFMSFLQSGLPDMTITDLKLSKLDIKNSTTNPKNAVMNSKLDIFLKMMNNNDKVELSYSNIEVNALTDEEMNLGKTVVPGFSHKPGNTTTLKITIAIVGGVVDKDDVLDLQDDDKKEQMVMQITIKSTIGFHVGIFRMNNVPILVGCTVQQFLLVNQVNQPPCNIRMFPTR